MIFVLFLANFVLALIFVRVLYQIRTNINFSERIFMNSVVVWLLFSLAVILFFQISMLGFALFTFILAFCLCFSPHFTRKIQKHMMHRQILPIVQSLVLNLRTGKGLEQSLAMAMKQQNPFLKQLFSVIIERSRHVRLAREDSSEKIFEFEQVLQRARNNSFQTRQIIEAYRYKLTTEYQFQKKVQVASSQTRGQTIVSIILYIAALVFLHFRYDIRDFLGVICLSASLTVLGAYISHKTASGFQWKV